MAIEGGPRIVTDTFKALANNTDRMNRIETNFQNIRDTLDDFSRKNNGDIPNETVAKVNSYLRDVELAKKQSGGDILHDLGKQLKGGVINDKQYSSLAGVLKSSFRESRKVAEATLDRLKNYDHVHTYLASSPHRHLMTGGVVSQKEIDETEAQFNKAEKDWIELKKQDQTDPKIREARVKMGQEKSLLQGKLDKLRKELKQQNSATAKPDSPKPDPAKRDSAPSSNKPTETAEASAAAIAATTAVETPPPLPPKPASKGIEIGSQIDPKNLVEVKPGDVANKLVKDDDIYGRYIKEVDEATDPKQLENLDLEIESDPYAKPELAELTINDRLVFIGVTFLLRMVSIMMVQWATNSEMILNLKEAFILYIILYCLFVMFLTFVVSTNEVGMQMLLYYFDTGTHGYSRILFHVFVVIILIPIFYVIKIPGAADTYNNSTYAYKQQMVSYISMFSWMVWLFTSIIALRF